MKKLPLAIITMAIGLLAILSFVIAAHAGTLSTQQLKKDITPQNAPTEFYANITFHVYEGEGCGCVPLRGVPINATGRDTDHITNGTTDDNGQCILQLEFDKTYRITIQNGDHESVLFDFVVIDNQAFSFHLKVIETSTPSFSLAQILLHRLMRIRTLFV